MTTDNFLARRMEPPACPGGFQLNRYNLFNFRDFLFEHPLNTLLEGYFSAGSAAAGAFQANFNHSAVVDINQLYIAAVSLEKRAHFS